MESMHAVAVVETLPIDDPRSLVDIDLPVPAPGPDDLLIEVQAISVNPIDVKQRMRAGVLTEPLVLGYDAVGTVAGMGHNVSGFAVGDRVWCAGDRTRPGSYAQFTLIDHRVAARPPSSLSDAEAAAMPLTSLTAWEALVDHIRLRPTESFLMIGGAGGVGSMAIQIARTLTEGAVVASASRDDSAAWCRDLGATGIVNHHQPLPAQIRDLGIQGVNGVLSAYTPGREAELAELMAPMGHLVMIDGTDAFDMLAFKPKSLSATSESMFTRTQFHTDDIAVQGEILTNVAGLVDAGRVRSTMTERRSGLSAATLREATALVESGRMIGKVVVEY